MDWKDGQTTREDDSEMLLANGATDAEVDLIMMVNYYIMIHTTIIKHNGPLSAFILLDFDPIPGVLSIRLIENAIRLKGFCHFPLGGVFSTEAYPQSNQNTTELPVFFFVIIIFC